MNFNALLLAAGYGTRLEREIKADESGQYSRLVGVSKALVPLTVDAKADGPTVLSVWLDLLDDAGVSHDCQWIVTNDRDIGQFTRWVSEHRPAFLSNHVLNDGSTSNETRRGAVADIAFALDSIGLDQPLIVIAGDTLFYQDFSLDQVLRLYRETAGAADSSSVLGLVLYYQLADHDEVRKRGILELEDAVSSNSSPHLKRVARFLEKPSPDETQSSAACPAFYVYSPAALRLLRDQFLPANTALPERDAPGKFAVWLTAEKPGSVVACQISGRFDVGGLTDYKSLLKTLKF